jgi:hypothetical protein
MQHDDNFPVLSKSNSESPIKGVPINEHLTRSRSLENVMAVDKHFQKDIEMLQMT